MASRAPSPTQEFRRLLLHLGRVAFSSLVRTWCTPLPRYQYSNRSSGNLKLARVPGSSVKPHTGCSCGTKRCRGSWLHLNQLSWLSSLLEGSAALSECSPASNHGGKCCGCAFGPGLRKSTSSNFSVASTPSLSHFSYFRAIFSRVNIHRTPWQYSGGVGPCHLLCRTNRLVVPRWDFLGASWAFCIRGRPHCRLYACVWQRLAHPNSCQALQRRNRKLHSRWLSSLQIGAARAIPAAAEAWTAKSASAPSSPHSNVAQRNLE